LFRIFIVENNKYTQLNQLNYNFKKIFVKQKIKILSDNPFCHKRHQDTKSLWYGSEFIIVLLRAFVPWYEQL